MDDKITIIEGPPPTFEEVSEGWATGLYEGPYLYEMVQTHLRTFNGNALVERCHRAWNEGSLMYLEYRDDLGLEKQMTILAARTQDTEEGQVLTLWLMREPELTETELDFHDDDDDSMDGDLD